MGRRRNSATASYTFSSRFEQLKVYAYLYNLVNSRFLHQKTAALFNFAKEMMGNETTVRLLKKVCPEVLDYKEFDEWVDCNRLDDKLPSKTLIKFLKDGIRPLLHEHIRKDVVIEPEIKQRIDYIRNLFGLTTEEVEIVIFLFLRECCPIIDSHLDCNDRIGSFVSVPFFRGHGHIPLGLTKARVLNALSDGGLVKSHLMNSGNNRLTLSDWGINYISGLKSEYDLFTKISDVALSPSDFNLHEDELMVLDALLKSRDGHNILFYGAPGAGKTSFAGSIARKYGKELLSVNVPNTDDHQDRLRAIYATVNIADKRKAIVLVDEADEILNTSDSFFFKSKTNKCWINTFLESHQNKVIWITNRSDQIDPSTMRRFSFSMEFRKIDSRKRLKIISHELEKKGMDKLFTDDELADICRNFSVDAGGIVNAIKVVGATRSTDKESAVRKIRTVLKNHEKATGGKSGDKNDREFSGYSLEGLNTSAPMEEIIAGANQYALFREKEPIKYNIPFTILLYGPPGTGKSEFVYYLGNRMKKEVILKRCSEIQSMWVGQTEKNIAAAFSEAREGSHLLFFDEADSFLHPRKDAHNSWEKDFTNEMLTQMESFRGVVVFATNDIEGLDHAALRRFRFKIEFRPLTPKGVLTLYETALQPLVGHQILPEEIARLMSIKNLTPGDFAVVKSQCLFMEPERNTHEFMIQALENEVRYKTKQSGKIGF